jgi:hypothetical protein
MADVLMGSRKTALEGGGRNEDGIIHTVKRIESQLENGGIKTKLVSKDRVALWTAVIGAFGLIIVAIIQAST